MGKVLLVDDDKDMLELTKRWFVKAGYDVTSVTSGPEALETMRESKPDLVILDVAMPGMDGPEVCRAMKGDDGLKDIPVVFRTGKEDEESVRVIEELNPAGIVSKSEGKNPLLLLVDGIVK